MAKTTKKTELNPVEKVVETKVETTKVVEQPKVEKVEKKAKKKVKAKKEEKAETANRLVLLNEYRRNLDGTVDVVNGVELIRLNAEFVEKNGIKTGSYIEVGKNGKVAYQK